MPQAKQFFTKKKSMWKFSTMLIDCFLFTFKLEFLWSCSVVTCRYKSFIYDYEIHIPRYLNCNQFSHTQKKNTAFFLHFKFRGIIFLDIFEIGRKFIWLCIWLVSGYNHMSKSLGPATFFSGLILNYFLLHAKLSKLNFRKIFYYE